MSTITKQQLQSYPWESANILRGKIDSGDFKHYILGLLFYKRLSDVFDEEYEKIKEQLSACETGSGGVQNGRGVFGLQRAIKSAGAETLIMSMWSVSDQATSEMMSLFYANWLGGMSKREALRKSQEKMRAKYSHPFY